MAVWEGEDEVSGVQRKKGNFDKIIYTIFQNEVVLGKKLANKLNQIKTYQIKLKRGSNYKSMALGCVKI